MRDAGVRYYGLIVNKSGYDPQTYQDFERSGWNRNAGRYADGFGRSTAPFADHLLDAAAVGAGTRLLDLACGPGDLTARAVSRGAFAVGVDLAEEMVAEAGRRYPQLEFREAPAEALPFGDTSFDATCCSFGMHHFAEPERAASEVYRVLAPNGRFAFTVWSGERSALFEIVMGAVKAHGDPDVPLPEGPPIFGPAKGGWKRLLDDAGFVDTVIEEITADLVIESADQVLDVVDTTVRTRALVEAQARPVRELIYGGIVDGARRLERDGAARIPMTGVLVSSRRPSP